MTSAVLFLFPFSIFHYRAIMASKNTKPRVQTYSLLTDFQKHIPKRHFDNGMVGIGRQYQEMVTRIAEETNLTRDKVEMRL